MRSDLESEATVSASSSREHSGKAIVAGFVVLVVGVVLYFALGMPGMDHGTGSSMVGMDMTVSSGPHRLAAPAEFETLLGDPSATVINVHVPNDGEIEGTDLLMPFDVRCVGWPHLGRRHTPPTRQPHPHPQSPRAPTPPLKTTPQERLAERFARGEIEADDYRQRLTALRHRPDS